MTDRNAVALEIVAYLRTEGRVSARQLCAAMGILSERTLREHIKYIREQLCWVNSSTTKGHNGYSVGVRDSRQVERHAASEFRLVTIQKRREKQNPPEQGVLFD